MKNRTLAVAAATVPALITLLIGLTHPAQLTTSTAEWWRDLHVILLPVFPLIGLAPWVVARDAGRPWRWIAAAGGYVWAIGYTSLDILAGIAAGSVTLAGHPEARSSLYAVANVLGPIGAAGLAVGFAAATIAAVRRSGVEGIVGGLLAVVGVGLVDLRHVYFPIGSLGLALLIGGAAILVLVATRSARPAQAARPARE